jgi:hypothetical protein
MASGRINLQANDARIATVTFEDGATGNVNVIMPKEGGVLASEDYAIGDSFETVSKNIKSFNFTMAYNGVGKLSTLTYTNGIIKTLSYNGSGQLSTVVLSGSTPSGIELTKTLTYTSGKLDGITYA